MSDEYCPICDIWPLENGKPRCRTCDRYWRRNGRERPHVLIERDRARAYTAHQGEVWAKVGTKITVLETGCWGWTGAKTLQVRVFGQQVYVHRILYEVLRGPLLAGAKLERRCGAGACVNPYHMDTRIRT